MKDETPTEAPDATDEEVTEDLKDFETKLKEMEDRYLRASADFENFRKRAAREREELAALVTHKLLREIVEVKDHLELALSHAEGAADVKALAEGVNLTLKQLTAFLEKTGVREVEAEGKDFDPNFHEALQQVESPQSRPGSVVQVFQKGYLLGGRLLRPARVIVATQKK